jgi:hypothetical protein
MLVLQQVLTFLNRAVPLEWNNLSAVLTLLENVRLGCNCLQAQKTFFVQCQKQRQKSFKTLSQVVPDSQVKVNFGMNLLNLAVCPHKQVDTFQKKLR